MFGAGYGDGCLAAWCTSGSQSLFCRRLLWFAPTVIKVFNHSQFAAIAGPTAAAVVIVHMSSQRVVQVVSHAAPVVALLIVKMKAEYYLYSITQQGAIRWTRARNFNMCCVFGLFRFFVVHGAVVADVFGCADDFLVAH